MSKEKQRARLIPENITKVRRKETIRTTFNLKVSTHENISWLLKNTVIKTKLIFFISTVTFQGNKEKAINEINKSINKIKNEKRKRRSFLIEKETLNDINKIYKTLKKSKITRDMLLEYGIDQFTKLMKKSEEEERIKIKKAHEISKELCNYIDSQIDDCKKILSEDDPIIHKFEELSVVAMNIEIDIENLILEKNSC